MALAHAGSQGEPMTRWMRSMVTLTTLGGLVAIGAPLAAADGLAGAQLGISASAPKIPVGFGARVGGYGFRNTRGQGGTVWDQCRMDGIGLFGNIGLGTHLFSE